MLGHIGITINHKEDIQKFYIDLLGFAEVADFEISQKISKIIFNIDESAPITTLEKDGLYLELFFCSNEVEPVYHHTALELHDRKTFINRMKKNDYPVKIVAREEKHDLIFIEDHSGNKFEIGPARK